MKYRSRTFYTDCQKALMWERWRQGEESDQADHKAPMAVRARRTSSMPSGVRGSCGARGGPTA